MSISANIPDRVKTELNLAIAEAARAYQKANDTDIFPEIVFWM